MLLPVLFLLILALVLLWQAARRQRSSGLPSGRVIYSDTQGWREVASPFFDSLYNLTGKPDYIVEKNGIPIPVELKSTSSPAAPYESHIYQLAAYCLLVERSSGKRPTHGIIRYRDRSFLVDYTPELEAALIQLLNEMRSLEAVGKSPPCSHNVVARCKRCGYRAMCSERLDQEE